MGAVRPAVIVFAGALLAAGAGALALASAGRLGETIRVSVNSDGKQAVYESYGGAVESSGSGVVFTSWSIGLVIGDTNGSRDVFHRDLVTGKTTRVSVATGGTQLYGHSGEGCVSAHGRFVAFSSVAPQAVPDDVGGGSDVFRHDRRTGSTACVSVNLAGLAVDGSSREPAISGSGRYVAFTSQAAQLVAGDSNGLDDVFVRDMLLATTTRVSVAPDGAQGDGPSSQPALSAHARFVAFASGATNLAPGDSNGLSDVFLHDRRAQTMQRVSVASGGAQAHGTSERPAISPDGRYVAFTSTAGDLVPGDTNGVADVFLHDRITLTTLRVSVATDGSQALGGSSGDQGVGVSARGQRIVFSSNASNLVPGDTNGKQDVFVRRLDGGLTLRISESPDGLPANKSSAWPAISLDGRHAIFESSSKNLVEDDTNGVKDVFLRDLK